MSPSTQPGRVGDRAVVVGASMAGMSAARVLAELYDSGAVALDVCGEFYTHQAGGDLRRPPSDLIGPSMTRPFLEATVRRHLAALSNVELRSGLAATGLEITAGRVTGVQVADGAVIPAALVVDATGRQARSLAWVKEAGFDPPAIDVVDVDTRYVSQMYQRAGFPASDWKAAAVIDEPETKRLAATSLTPAPPVPSHPAPTASTATRPECSSPANETTTSRCASHRSPP